MSLRLVIGHASDVGLVRDHNEDGYLVDPHLALVAIADGMGGHRGGDVASATALDAFHASFTDTGGLRDAVRAANNAVLERSSHEPRLRGMGTTLTSGVLSEDGTLLVGHVGDSRAYLLRDRRLTRITTDHSLVEELMAAGELTEEEAEHDPRRSMITRALGLEPDLDVDLYPIPVEVGDRVLLCSDGLTAMLHDDEIASILAEESDSDKAARRLIEAANAAGGVDNTTVLVLDVVDSDSVVQHDDGNGSKKRRRGIFRRR
jgi:protein phosphatase